MRNANNAHTHIIHPYAWIGSTVEAVLFACKIHLYYKLMIDIIGWNVMLFSIHRILLCVISSKNLVCDPEPTIAVYCIDCVCEGRATCIVSRTEPKLRINLMKIHGINIQIDTLNLRLNTNLIEDICWSFEIIKVSHKNMDFYYDWIECLYTIHHMCADKVEQIRWAIIVSVAVFAYESTDMCLCVCIACIKRRQMFLSVNASEYRSFLFFWFFSLLFCILLFRMHKLLRPRNANWICREHRIHTLTHKSMCECVFFVLKEKMKKNHKM